MNKQTELAITTTLETIKQWVVFYVDATVKAQAKTVTVADIKTMAAKLVQLRLARKTTTARIGIALKSTSQHVKDLEAGTVKLTVDEMITLSAYYGVPISYLAY